MQDTVQIILFSKIKINHNYFLNIPIFLSEQTSDCQHLFHRVFCDIKPNHNLFYYLKIWDPGNTAFSSNHRAAKQLQAIAFGFVRINNYEAHQLLTNEQGNVIKQL